MDAPVIAFGCGTKFYRGYSHNIDGSDLDESVVASIVQAIEVGFRHIDLAEMYGNDREVGEALRRCNIIDRGDIFITSKLVDNMASPEAGLDLILERIGTSYVDLLLLHCPVAFQRALKNDDGCVPDISVVWGAMESLLARGKAKRIGVSNFRIEDLEELLCSSTIMPFVNQVEFNPYLQQQTLREFCTCKGVRMAAYSPLASINLHAGGPVDAVISDLASRYGRSGSQILLQYAVQKGYIAVTTSSNRHHLIEALNVMLHPLSLSAADMTRIDTEGGRQVKRHFWRDCYRD